LDDSYVTWYKNNPQPFRVERCKWYGHWNSRSPNRPLSVENLVVSVELDGTVKTESYQDDSLSSLSASLSSLQVSPPKNASLSMCTYNVNGLANLVRKGYFRRFLVKHSPDVLLLTEVKMSLRRLFTFKPLHVRLEAFGYHFCYYNPQVRDHGGLHGTAIISKIKPEKVICGYCPSPDNPQVARVEDTALDDAQLSMDSDGRCITAVFPPLHCC